MFDVLSFHAMLCNANPGLLPRCKSHSMDEPMEDVGPRSPACAPAGTRRRAGADLEGLAEEVHSVLLGRIACARDSVASPDLCRLDWGLRLPGRFACARILVKLGKSP